jgi:hypothetical protein
MQGGRTLYFREYYRKNRNRLLQRSKINHHNKARGSGKFSEYMSAMRGKFGARGGDPIIITFE